MFHDGGQTVVHKRMSFLSVFFLSFAAVLITIIVAATSIGIYGIHVVDSKSGDVVGLVESAMKGLPEFRAALPPALADAINDERRPDYLKNVEVSVRLRDQAEGDPFRRAIVEVTNNGDEVISLLTMRVVGLDGEGEPVREWNTCVATPLQIEDEWRGPLLPHETRQYPLSCYVGHGCSRRMSNVDCVSLSHEVTDVRVWKPTDHEAADTALASSRPTL